MVGVSIGIVTFLNFCQPPAPSSSAASYSEGGMPLRPASQMMTLPPTVDQRLMMTMEGSAHFGSKIQPGPAMPK